MTKKELSQLYWLNREIEEEKRKLRELEAASTSGTAKITGLPHVSGADGLPALVSRDSENLFDMVERKEAGDDGTAAAD